MLLPLLAVCFLEMELDFCGVTYNCGYSDYANGE